MELAFPCIEEEIPTLMFHLIAEFFPPDQQLVLLAETKVISLAAQATSKR
jgi:hypothetical protein